MDLNFSSILTTIATFLALYFTFQRDRDNRIYDKIEKKANQTDLDSLSNRVDAQMKQTKEEIMARLDNVDDALRDINKFLRERR